MLSSKTIKALNSTNLVERDEAFKAIYDEYKFLCYYVALGITKSKEMSEDIVSDTFIELIKRSGSIASEGNLKSYLAITAKNKAINQIKQSEKIVTIDEEVPSDGQTIIDDFASYVEQFSRFLNEEELDLVVYKFLYGFSFKEIAQLFGKTFDGVKSKYRRTIEKIRQEYR